MHEDDHTDPDTGQPATASTAESGPSATLAGDLPAPGVEVPAGPFKAVSRNDAVVHLHTVGLRDVRPGDVVDLPGGALPEGFDVATPDDIAAWQARQSAVTTDEELIP